MSTPTLLDYLPLVITIIGTLGALILGVIFAIKLINLILDAFKGSPPPEGIERVKIDPKKAAIYAVLHTVAVLFALGAAGMIMFVSAYRLIPSPALLVLVPAILVIANTLFHNFIMFCAFQVEEERRKKALAESQVSI